MVFEISCCYDQYHSRYLHPELIMKDEIQCPICEGLAFRIKRTFLARLIGRFIKSARYGCSCCRHEFTLYGGQFQLLKGFRLFDKQDQRFTS